MAIRKASRLVLREAIGAGIPLALGAALLLAVPEPGQSQGETAREKPLPSSEFCGGWHRGSGETTALDLAAVRRAYENLEKNVRASLSEFTIDLARDLDRPYDAGLPACRSAARRVEKFPHGDSARLRGKSFYFLAVSNPDEVVLPPEVAGSPSAEVLVLRARTLRDIPRLGERLGRPVSLSGREFANALGVRCTPTSVRISEEGDELDLLEGR